MILLMSLHAMGSEASGCDRNRDICIHCGQLCRSGRTYLWKSGLVVKQLTAITAVLVYSLLMTTIILKALDATMGLRVSDEHEVEGLDVSQHGEKAYL